MQNSWMNLAPARLLFLGSLVAACGFATSAAAWKFEDGVATTTPSASNSNIVQLELGCGDPYHFGVFTEHGPVLTKDGRGESDYFYEPGRIQAVIDGAEFPLVAAGSGDAVVLLAEGSQEDNYLADIDDSFIETIKQGSELLLRFDIVPENAADGSPFETYSLFTLPGAKEAIEEALKDCSS
ncbi:hypothetical protein GCM10011385_25510 [Nitratireductor aestuarii]|uniref:Uncharacterized protein n=1 Tax=Nitratireductor aestuarii TaxID=1735103 RepID=A0A916RW42_9HYPH|nr:hypothetical protein [Nitratireductor aestuarii]GGA70560.1 hypothetical protein GCM10011385_25510 [Nitratireductor aestuarii]